LRERVLGQFIHENEEALKEFSLPWFIPERFGGLGLPEVGRYRARTYDIQVARFMYENPDSYPVTAVSPDTPWAIWKWATKAHPRPPTDVMNSDFVGQPGMVSYKTVLGWACVEAIFRVSSFEELYTKKEDGKFDISAAEHSSEMRSYRKRERQWAKASKALEKVSNKGPPKWKYPAVIPDMDDTGLFFHTQHTMTQNA
jgi:hypothetical protein